MSLFNELSQEGVIENIKETNNYKKILSEKKKKDMTWKELVKKKKSELPLDEFKKWQQAEYYKRKFKEKKLKDYYERRAIDNEVLEEAYEYVYGGDEILDYDKFYTEKFKNDDVISRGYNFAWRSSKLMRIQWKYTPKQKEPFRVSERRCMHFSTDRLFKMQIQAYEYLKPHLDEIKDCNYILSKKQQIYAPSYFIEEPLKTIAENGPVNRMRIMNVADGMIRGKFFPSELYLGRDNFIFGDVLVTGTGNVFRIALENNLPWLTKDTVEDIHKKRMDWRKSKSEDRPPIYIANDAYLIKIAVNERENLYYIVPT